MSVFWRGSLLVIALSACADGVATSFIEEAKRDESGLITEPGQVGVLRLEPGDCFFFDGDDIESVAAVPCADQHEAEVFSIFDLGDGDWPGANAVEQVAINSCLARFRPATGIDFDPTQLGVTGLAPSESSWSDDRTVICVLTAQNSGLLSGRLSR